MMRAVFVLCVATAACGPTMDERQPAGAARAASYLNSLTSASKTPGIQYLVVRATDVLFEYAGGPGRVAIHGARGVLWAEAGTNPSHGCIRVPDPGIRKVVPLVSPGTPVDIVA